MVVHFHKGHRPIAGGSEAPAHGGGRALPGVAGRNLERDSLS